MLSCNGEGLLEILHLGDQLGDRGDIDHGELRMCCRRRRHESESDD